jgi:NAD-dependent deacetylase
MSSEDHGLIEIDGPVVFFTGAGVSVGAGLPTYRGTGGLYTSSTDEPPHADDLTPERLPGLWEKFGPRLRAAGDLRPAAAHEAIAAFEAASEEPVTVVTQNVDGLHSAAGSTRVVELHGSLLWVRCIPNDHVQELADTTWNGDNVPACFTCGSPCRPGVVLFGEGLDGAVWDRAEQAIREARTIVSVGTSAVVYPAVLLIGPSRAPDAARIWINPEDEPPSPGWRWLRGTADEQVPRLRPRDRSATS